MSADGNDAEAESFLRGGDGSDDRWGSDDAGRDRDKGSIAEKDVIGDVDGRPSLSRTMR
jgi:hypothetical protein